jgi:hypothetical protein
MKNLVQRLPMGFPWGILVAFAVLLVAHLMNRVFKEWMEDEKYVWMSVGGFLLLYALAAGLTVYLSPTVPATASVRSIYDTLSGAND